MINFSEVLSDVSPGPTSKTTIMNNNFNGQLSEMSGGLSDDELRKISRATMNQKNKFHEEAVEKINALLPTKDLLTARAVKAIIYDEIKQSNQNLSGLDRAAELIKAVTKKKVDEVLKQKDLIKKITEYLETRRKENEGSNEKSGKTSSKTTSVEKTKTKRATEKTKTKGKKADIDFESSVTETSYYDSSDGDDNISSSPIVGKSKNKSKSNTTRNFFDF